MFSKCELKLIKLNFIYMKEEFINNKKAVIENVTREFLSIFNLHIYDVHDIFLDYFLDTTTLECAVGKFEQLIFGE